MMPSLQMLHAIRNEIKERNPSMSDDEAVELAVRTPEGEARYRRYRSELLVGAHQ
jgi:hypothetical protein